MRITDVRVFPVRDEKLKAFVSVVLEGCFMVNDIKVINGREGYFISMPSRRKKNGEFKDIAHPLNTDTRRLLEARILDEYEQVVAVDDPPVRRYEKERDLQPAAASETRDPEPPATERQFDRPRQSRPEPPPPSESNQPQAAERDEFGDNDGAGGGRDGAERTDLEEVVKDHLSDSFWS